MHGLAGREPWGRPPHAWPVARPYRVWVLNPLWPILAGRATGGGFGPPKGVRLLWVDSVWGRTVMDMQSRNGPRGGQQVQSNNLSGTYVWIGSASGGVAGRVPESPIAAIRHGLGHPQVRHRLGGSAPRMSGDLAGRPPDLPHGAAGGFGCCSCIWGLAAPPTSCVRHELAPGPGVEWPDMVIHGD